MVDRATSSQIRILITPGPCILESPKYYSGDVEMTEEQRGIIYRLTRDDAIRLIEARDISTWECICKNIQELARSGALLPINVLQFYTVVSWDISLKQYVVIEVHLSVCPCQ